jgi:hypothetical protein
MKIASRFHFVLEPEILNLSKVNPRGMVFSSVSFRVRICTQIAQKPQAEAYATKTKTI